MNDYAIIRVVSNSKEEEILMNMLHEYGVKFNIYMEDDLTLYLMSEEDHDLICENIELPVYDTRTVGILEEDMGPMWS